MEYDRGLYRVYEKTLDDLIASNRRMGLTSNNGSAQNRNRVTSNDAGESNSSESSSNHQDSQMATHASTFQQQEHRTHNDEHLLSFFLPNPFTISRSFTPSSPVIRRPYLVRNLFRWNSSHIRQNNDHDDNDTISIGRRIVGSTYSTLSRFSSNSTRDEEMGHEMRTLSPTSLSLNLSIPPSPSGLRRRSSPIRELSSPSNSFDAVSSLGDYDDYDIVNDRSIHIESSNSVDIVTDMDSHHPGNVDASVSSETTQMARNIAASQMNRSHESATTNNSSDHYDNGDHDDSHESFPMTLTGLLIVMRLAFIFAILHLVILSILHFTYVGPRISNTMADNRQTKAIATLFARTFGNDHTMTCLEQALVTRPFKERSQYKDKLYYQYASSGDKSSAGSVEVEKKPIYYIEEPALFGANEILQINIIYGNCQGQCSKVRNLDHSLPDSVTLSEDKDKYYSSSAYWKNPHYRFSTKEALSALDEGMLNWFKVPIVNVTLTERCLSTGTDEGTYKSFITKIAQFLAPIYGMDTVVANQLIYGIKSADGKYRSGFFKNLRTKNQFDYAADAISHHEEASVTTNIREAILKKLNVLFRSIGAFVFITSITALVVRVLTSSGTMMLFPCLSVCQRLGISIDDRVLDHAHPWLGFARTQIQRSGNSISPFICAHLTKLLLIYSMYEACQSTIGVLLYSKKTTTDLPIFIFAINLILEYFSLIYVRSALR